MVSAKKDKGMDGENREKRSSFNSHNMAFCKGGTSQLATKTKITATVNQ